MRKCIIGRPLEIYGNGKQPDKKSRKVFLKSLFTLIPLLNHKIKFYGKKFITDIIARLKTVIDLLWEIQLIIAES